MLTSLHVLTKPHFSSDSWNIQEVTAGMFWKWHAAAAMHDGLTPLQTYPASAIALNLILFGRSAGIISACR